MFRMIVVILLFYPVIEAGDGLVENLLSLLPREIAGKLDSYWDQYKSTYNKSYSLPMEMIRRLAWEENLIKIYEHNLLAAAGHHTYTLRDNEFADLSPQQYIMKMVKLISSRWRRLANDEVVGAIYHNPGEIPSSLDWREKGFVTPPENQKDCGSCYAYSISQSIQGQVFKKTGKLIQLSPQQIVDCSSSAGNLGCNGGSLRNTMKYLEKVGGLMPASEYPYTAQQGTCVYKKHRSAVNITSWAILPARDESAIEAALATIGPIAASINASPRTFQLYHKGVYDDPGCSSDVVNHAMLLVGYTPNEWILKNWWGEHWGENGYMRLARNKNRCGISNYVAWVKV